MNLKEIYLEKLWNENGVIITSDPITLKSNRYSYVYINNRNLICLPQNIKLLTDIITEVIKDFKTKDYAICNVNSSLSPFIVSSLSIQNNIPIYLMRYDDREKGIPLHYYLSFSGNQRDIVSKCFRYDWNVTYDYQKNLPAILIDDVVTSSKTINRAAIDMKTSGVEVIGAAVLVDRRTDKDKKDNSIPIYSAFTMKDVIQYILTNSIDENAKTSLERELYALEQ